MAYFNRTSVPGTSADDGAAGLRGQGITALPPPQGAPAESPRDEHGRPISSAKLEAQEKQKVRDAVAERKARELEKDARWIELSLTDDDGNPLAGQAFEAKDAEGKVVSGTLDANGCAKVEELAPGFVSVRFLLKKQA